MNEKDKYLNIYKGSTEQKSTADIIPGKMGGGYGRICWGENMLETLKDWKVAALLDVGCGYGNFCDAAALFVPRVYGLDIASVATGNVIDNPEVTYLDGEAKNIGLPHNAVEWITSFDCLEHCLEADIDAILKEFDRVAVKGFVLSISYEPCEMDGMPLHMTVKPESWWVDKLSAYGLVTKAGHAPITGAPYLICRKPVAQKVVCYCAGSLGTRLRSLALADDLARRTQRKLTLLWLPNDPLCRASFSELFTNPIPEISEEGLISLESCKIYANVKEVADQALISGGRNLRKAVQKWGCSASTSLSMNDMEDHVVIYAPHPQEGQSIDGGFQLAKQLSPTPQIQDRIRTIQSELNLDNRFMGVNARGTDFGIQVGAYGEQMTRAIRQNPNQKFWVVSDEEKYERELKQRFHQHVVIRNKCDWSRKKDQNRPWTLDNIDTSKSSVIEALTDLYLLGHTDFRIYHESSAYAQLGVALSKCPPIGSPLPINMPSTRNMENPSEIAMDGKDRTTIFYLCPDILTSSAGIRRLYRHVSMLNADGFTAFILHEKNGFQLPDMPRVPIRYMDQIGDDRNAVFVIPEGMPKYMHGLKHHPGRRIVIALNWHYIFKTLPDGMDWRHFNIERVLAVSPVIAKMVSWSMGLPTHVLGSSVDHHMYDVRVRHKRHRVVFIQRKAAHIDLLKRILDARNPDYVNKIEWMGLHGLPEADYANRIREAALFLNLSSAEGLPTSCLEAMASGTLVAGYDSVGGRDLLCGHGIDQNCIIAPLGDYVSLAYALEPALKAILAGDLGRWQPIISNALKTAGEFTPENETSALISFWHSVCADKNRNAA